MRTPESRPDLDTLVALQAAFAATIDAVDPRARVPSCGSWRVAHLVNHLTRVHHWARACALRTHPEPLGRARLDTSGAYRHHADALASTLAALPPTDEAPLVRVSGPARSLALLLWGRTGPDDATLRVEGPDEALRAVLAQALTP